MNDGWVLGGKLPGFDYPEKFCRFCEREMKLDQAAHVSQEPHLYKAVYFCLNNNCGAYDEAARKCYVRVYYSDPQAEKLLYGFRIWMPRKSV